MPVNKSISKFWNLVHFTRCLSLHGGFKIRNKDRSKDFKMRLFLIYILKKQLFTLAGVARVVGHHPANRKVPGLIPGQGTSLGCCLTPRARACATHT